MNWPRPGQPERRAGPASGTIHAPMDPREPVSPLRGAGVGEVDVQRLGQAALVAALVGVAVLAAVLWVAGAHRNAQIDRLHHEGVPVVITVTGCVGQLGGSGSNAAGYACRGAFTLGGHRHVEAIPGDRRYDPGATVRGVAVPGDPALVTTAAALAGERASARVDVLPVVLLVLLVAVVALLLVRRHRRHIRTTRPAPRPRAGA